MFKKLIQGTKMRLSSLKIWAIILLIVLFLVSFVRTAYKIFEARKAINLSKDKITSLKLESENLQKELQKTQSEAFIESQLRDKLGMAKEGEIIVVLPDSETLRKLVREGEKEEVMLSDPNWKKWFKLFF